MMTMTMMMMMKMKNFPWVFFGETLGQSASKSVWIRRQKCGCGTVNEVLTAQGLKQFIHVCKTPAIRNPPPLVISIDGDFCCGSVTSLC